MADKFDPKTYSLGTKENQRILGSWFEIEGFLAKGAEEEYFHYCQSKKESLDMMEAYNKVRQAWKAQRMDVEHKIKFDHIAMIGVYDHHVGLHKIVWFEKPDAEPEVDFSIFA